jgi:HK97 family phage major capsid protein
MNPVQLREQRAKLVSDARNILDKAESEKRTLLAEEQEQIDSLFTEAEKVKAAIDTKERADKLANLETDLKKSTRQIVTSQETRHNPAQFGDSLRAWLLAGTDRPINGEMIEAAAHNGINLHSRWLTLRPLEKRAQSKGTLSAGGYAIADEPMAGLERALKYFGPMRQVARILTTATGNDLPIPTNNDVANVGAILAENTQDSEQDTTFGQIVLKAYKYTSKIIRVSIELLQDSHFNFDEFLGQTFAERIGRIQNTHFTSGTGSGQPNGVVTAAADSGITAAVSSLTFDNLIDLVHSIDPLYRGNGRFMMNDSTVSTIRKLKDSQNRYLWEPATQVGQPDRILGYPVSVNNDMAAIGANNKSVLFGDFAKYLIRDTLDLTFNRLDERYAEFHQVAFVMIARSDANLLDAGTAPLKYLDHAAA